ncbi:MAG: hypothetical protein OZ934_00535 [Anaerolineae bacterium]|nr:hypothetical protein [Anaerolineae bacterium]
MFVHWLLTGAQFLDHALVIHPGGDFTVAVMGRQVHVESTPHNHCLTRVDIQACRTFFGTFGHANQIVTQRRVAAVELATHGTLTFGTFGFRAQVARVERRPHRQHLLHHRPVWPVIIILAEPFHAEQLQSILAAQQHLDHDRMIMVAREPVKLPHGDPVKFASLSRRPHFLEPFTVQAPAILCAILVDADHHSTLFGDQLAAYRFLVVQADLILHFGRVPGIDGIPGTLARLFRHDPFS